MFPFLKGRFKSRSIGFAKDQITPVSIPQRKIQEEREAMAQEALALVSIPQRKIQERSPRAVAPRGPRFPFLKGRFKSDTTIEAARPFRNSFHSSKEDSRGGGAGCIRPAREDVSIPQRKIQEEPGIDQLVPVTHVSIPQRKIQESPRNTSTIS